MTIGGRYPSRTARPTVGGCVCAFMAMTLVVALSAADEPSSSTPRPGGGSSSDNRGVNPYSKLSNKQLGALAGTFDDLDRDERRWFLTEVRKRMSGKGEGPQIDVRGDDRFGQVAREVDRSEQRSGVTHNPIETPPAVDKRAEATEGTAATEATEATEATKVYGTGPQIRPPETADGSTPTLQSEDKPTSLE